MRALVLGGTGHVGRAVLAALGEPAWFTCWRSDPAALEAQGHRAIRLDLRDAGAIATAMAALEPAPSIVIHCAAHQDWRGLEALDVAAWDDFQAITVRAPFLVVQALAPRWHAGASVVLCTGLSSIRPVEAPPQAAAAHAGLVGLARALTRSLGKRNVKVNCVALGILDGGTATHIDPKYLADHPRHTALARNGTATEAARAIVWLATENRYMSGAVLPITGGI